MQEGDEILSVNGHNLHRPLDEAVTVLLSELKTGKVTFKISRRLSPKELLDYPSPQRRPNTETNSSSPVPSSSSEAANALNPKTSSSIPAPATSLSSQSEHQADENQKVIAEEVMKKLKKTKKQHSQIPRQDRELP